MATESAAGDDLHLRRKRLRFRAWHRGTREMDLILGPFADRFADGMGDEELGRCERLLEEPDTELLKWVLKQEAPPADADRDLIERLQRFAR
jgi:antitoxin CptB